MCWITLAKWEGGRKHQHLLNAGRALLYQSKLPKTFLSYAISYVSFVINKVNTPLINHRPPYQLICHTLLDINQIKVFGFLCYASPLVNHSTKLDGRARKSVFLGYVVGYKGSLILDLHSHEKLISRNVTYHEHILPYQVQNSSVTQNWEYFSNLHHKSETFPLNVYVTPVSNVPIHPHTQQTFDIPKSNPRVSKHFLTSFQTHNS